MRVLPTLPKLEDEEILLFIDHHDFHGRGLGLIDMHLLASCLVSNMTLWTRDAALARAANELGLGQSL